MGTAKGTAIRAGEEAGQGFAAAFGFPTPTVEIAKKALEALAEAEEGHGELVRQFAEQVRRLRGKVWTSTARAGTPGARSCCSRAFPGHYAARVTKFA